MKNTIRQNKGITLIALVITIIVLLILAGVTIAMLSGENGILSRATETRSTNADAQADEQAKLAYMGVRTEIIAERVTNASYNAASAENTTTLGQKVKKELDPNNATKPWKVEYGTAGTITMTFEDSSLNKTNHQIVYEIILPGAGETTVTLKKDNVDMATGGSGGSGGDTPVPPTPAGITGVDFGEGKTKDDVAQGDTIEITFGEGASAYKEQFMMLTKANNQIVAMPYYNITQSTTDPRQNSDTSVTGTLAFSDSNFWNAETVNIEPMSSSNIQQYIDAYSKKLKLATGGTESGGIVTGGKVTATVGRYYGTGIDNISSFSGQSNSESKKLLNPSGVGDFWLGSSGLWGDYDVSFVATDGYVWDEDFEYNRGKIIAHCGVRPVILIDIS